MPSFAYRDHWPTLGQDVRLASDAFLVGRVTVTGPARFAESSVARGDQSPIDIGPRFCLGQRSTVHVELDHETCIGSDVWVGDGAVVHASTLADGTRIEDGALILSRSTIGPGSIVAADALVPESSTFPENSYIAGTPGRRQRDTTLQERQETLERVRQALMLAPG